jgi:hypothetical protein
MLEQEFPQVVVNAVAFGTPETQVKVQEVREVSAALTRSLAKQCIEVYIVSVAVTQRENLVNHLSHWLFANPPMFHYQNPVAADRTFALY